MLKVNNKILNHTDGDLWIAFSGGKDSVAMAHRLKKYTRIKNNIKGLLHFNHGFDMSDTIEREARLTADHLKLDWYPGKVLKPFNFNSKRSVEDWCREKRYLFFDQFPGRIVVCHHLGDAAESYMMNCLKGQPEYKPIPSVTERANNVIIRPFIGCKSKEVVKYLDENDLQLHYKHDPMNDDPTILRVKIRRMLRDFPGTEKVVLKKFYLDK